jgi:L-ribulose-5-phosphate 3-epimerase
MVERTKRHLAVCSWSLKPESPGDLVEKLQRIGLNRIQMHLTGDAALDEAMQAALSEPDIVVVSGMMTPLGEDYSTLASIRRTGGVVVDELWSANRELALQVAERAAAMGLERVSLHAGFIPEDDSCESFHKLRDRVTELADLFGERGLHLLLETGQETAEGLEHFLEACGRPNLKVNFDPANMILYGMGDPIEALERLMPLVEQVHLKDALPSDEPGVWGAEVPVGEGAVDWPAYVNVLKRSGYAGDMVIEREAGTDRERDIQRAADRIGALL